MLVTILEKVLMISVIALAIGMAIIGVNVFTILEKILMVPVIALAIGIAIVGVNDIYRYVKNRIRDR